jgi:SAM-dependent methyltransferase
MQSQEKDTSSEDNWSQFKCPTGALGRKVAANMNKGHLDLTTWGLKHVSINPDSIILDVGCGGGKTISRLTRRAVQGKIYGMDCSAEMVEFSKQVNKKLVKTDRVEIVQGSVAGIGFRDDFFDLVTAIETYYFWPNLAGAFVEIKRVLKKEGWFLVISEMIKDGLYEVENAEIIFKTHVQLVELEEMQKMLYSAGFSRVKIHRKRKSFWNAVLAQK